MGRYPTEHRPGRVTVRPAEDRQDTWHRKECPAQGTQRVGHARVSSPLKKSPALSAGALHCEMEIAQNIVATCFSPMVCASWRTSSFWSARMLMISGNAADFSRATSGLFGIDHRAWLPRTTLHSAGSRSSRRSRATPPRPAANMLLIAREPQPRLDAGELRVVEQDRRLRRRGLGHALRHRGRLGSPRSMLASWKPDDGRRRRTHGSTRCGSVRCGSAA